MSDDKLVERVARAICDQHGRRWHELRERAEDSAWDDETRHHFRLLACAAIEAMAELPEEPGPRYIAGEYSRRTQEAMVDDALRYQNVTGDPEIPY